MKSLFAFIKKELLDGIRTGKFLIFGVLFVFFGLMNPAIAKLTPYLLEVMSDALAETGMSIESVKVDALTSWTQFFKNIPMALIVFVLVYSGSFTKEYDSGTLILVLSKGFPRYRVVLAKLAVILSVWTLGYWLCFAITAACNAYFWDNQIAVGLFPSATLWWLFGVWTIALIVLFSTIARSYIGVLLGVGGVVLASYLLGLFSQLHFYTPTALMDHAPLLLGMQTVSDYLPAILITALLSVGSIIAAFPLMNQKQI